MGRGAFEGDHRTAASGSIDGKTTSRTHGFVFFNQFGPFWWYAGSSGTHYKAASLWGDDIEAWSTAEVSLNFARDPLAGPSRFAFSASTAGANPLVKPSPNIDTKIKVLCDFSRTASMWVEGEVFGDNFPNLEVFIFCFQSKHSAILVDGRTTGGATTGPATRLLGASEGNSLARFNSVLQLNGDGGLAADTRAPPAKI